MAGGWQVKAPPGPLPGRWRLARRGGRQHHPPLALGLRPPPAVARTSPSAPPARGGAHCPRGQLGLDPSSLFRAFRGNPTVPLPWMEGSGWSTNSWDVLARPPSPEARSISAHPATGNPQSSAPRCEAPAVGGSRAVLTLSPASSRRCRAWAHGLHATGPGSPAGPGPRRKPPGATLGKKPTLLAGGGPRLIGGPALCSPPPPTRPGLQGLTELGGWEPAGLSEPWSYSWLRGVVWSTAPGPC